MSKNNTHGIQVGQSFWVEERHGKPMSEYTVTKVGRINAHSVMGHNTVSFELSSLLTVHTRYGPGRVYLTSDGNTLLADAAKRARALSYMVDCIRNVDVLAELEALMQARRVDGRIVEKLIPACNLMSEHPYKTP
jgi:hypothetical protein